jgi:hypothetical protein
MVTTPRVATVASPNINFLIMVFLLKDLGRIKPWRGNSVALGIIKSRQDLKVSFRPRLPGQRLNPIRCATRDTAVECLDTGPSNEIQPPATLAVTVQPAADLRVAAANPNGGGGD